MNFFLIWYTSRGYRSTRVIHNLFSFCLLPITFFRSARIDANAERGWNNVWFETWRPLLKTHQIVRNNEVTNVTRFSFYKNMGFWSEPQYFEVQAFLTYSLFEIRYAFFLYKHLAYKHAQPQILEKFKHVAKHAPGWDFLFAKNYWWFFKNMPNFIHFWSEFHKIKWKLW